MSMSYLTMSSLFAILVGLAGPTWPVAVQARSGDGHSGHNMKCAEECSNCQRACDSCATHCVHLLTQGKKEHAVTLRTCQDCATHCSAAASIVARDGPFSDLICKACADACARCGKECKKYDDTHMKRCADACQKCEQACREMLTHVGAATTRVRD